MSEGVYATPPVTSAIWFIEIAENTPLTIDSRANIVSVPGVRELLDNQWLLRFVNIDSKAMW